MTELFFCLGRKEILPDFSDFYFFTSLPRLWPLYVEGCSEFVKHHAEEAMALIGVGFEAF